MKILLVVMKERRAVIDHLYQSISDNDIECDVLRLSDEEQDQLQHYFSANINIAAYDRIIFVLRSKKMFRQPDFFQRIDNLIFLEYDAWQNYVKVKNRGKFTALYRCVPWARIIVSGHMLANRLRDDGFDAVFVPKGFDDNSLRNLHQNRSIELGFIGSTNNSIYEQRVNHLQQIAKRETIVQARTYSADEYLHKLNSIKFFVSADLGFNEYMLKNFEAMACGCVVFAFNHGTEENEALGLRDMENIVLYNGLDEFFTKLNILRNQPALANAIAEHGEQLVRQNNAFSVLGPRIIAALRPPLRNRSTYPPTKTTLLTALRQLLSRRG